MKKILSLIMVLSILILLTSCDVVIAGHECRVEINSYAENENYVIFSEAIFNKSTQTFSKTLTKDNKMYDTFSKPIISIQSNSFTVESHNGDTLSTDTFDFNGKMISSEEMTGKEYEESLLEEGFYSSYQRRNWDKEELTEAENAIWEYSKAKSVKPEWPYWIVGKCKETETEIIFIVNVYNKVMWAGQSLVNQGAVSSTLNSYNKTTNEIEELYFYDKCLIKDFYDKYIYFYQKSDNSFYYKNLETNKSHKIEKVNDWHIYNTTDKYCLIADMNRFPYKYKLIELS